MSGTQPVVRASLCSSRGSRAWPRGSPGPGAVLPFAHFGEREEVTVLATSSEKGGVSGGISLQNLGFSCTAWWMTAPQGTWARLMPKAGIRVMPSNRPFLQFSGVGQKWGWMWEPGPPSLPGGRLPSSQRPALCLLPPLPAAARPLSVSPAWGC